MADTPYRGDIATLRDDRHTAMREQTRNICVCACVFASLCLLTAEVVPSPADADLMRVADCHIRRHEVTLVILVVQVPGPHDVTELLRSDLRTRKACPTHEGLKLLIIFMIEYCVTFLKSQ